jgi:phage terminase large subunit-like protein
MTTEALDLAHDPAEWIDLNITTSELGKPFALSPYQRRVLAEMFCFDQAGKVWIDQAVWSEPKKGGKTTLAACIGLWWGDTQEAPNEVLVIANDQEQALARAFGTMVELLKRNRVDRDGNPGIGSRARRKTTALIEFTTGTTIRAIASEFAGAAGSNHGLTLWDEIWAGVTERYRRLWDELTPVPTRLNSIRLVFSYSGFQGESKTLWDLYLAGVDAAEHPEGRGERIDPELPIYRSKEGAGLNLVTFWSHECRQPWQTEGWLGRQRQDHIASGRVSTWLRLFENRWVSGESAFITADLWDACVDGAGAPLTPGKGPVYVGVDIGIKNDTTGITALREERDGDRRLYRLVYHRIMRPTPGTPVDHRDIADCLRWVHRRLRPRRIGIDPSQALQMAADLKREGLPIIEVPQTAATVDEMGQTLITVIQSRALVVYPDAALRQQALNTVAVEKPDGMMRMDKAKSGRKIDAIVAMALALWMAAPVRAEGMLAEFAESERAEGLAPVADRRTRFPKWFHQYGQVGEPVMGRDGEPIGTIVKMTTAGITVRATDGTERTFSQGTFKGYEDRRIELTQIDQDAARHGWERDPDTGEWVRSDGTVMKAQRIPLGLGEVGWYRFDPDTDEPIGLDPDSKCEMGPEPLELAPFLPCPFYPATCTGVEHQAQRVGTGWVVVCPNNRERTGVWDRDQLGREAIRPDARPMIELYPPGQEAAPGTKTTGWSSPTGGSKR